MEHLTEFVSSFVDELALAGVEAAVVSPGSRSTPLAYAIAEHPRLKMFVHLDERSAAFFALGMAKASKRPVALLCTSGTAAANYFPAIVEAKISRVPLIVLTSDRPHELRDVGAPQAIDQLDLYGKHTKWFVEMPLPEAADFRSVRLMAARAAATASARPAGPVHLNFPFREPLVPDFVEMQWYYHSEPVIQIAKSEMTISDFSTYVERINAIEKGLIVCGESDAQVYAADLLAFAERMNFPVLVDPLSNLRTGLYDSSVLITTYDTFLRGDRTETLRPELIIRFGAMPVSKALTNFIKNSNATQWVIDEAVGWREPTGTATEMIGCEPGTFIREVSAAAQKLSLDYFERWRALEQVTKDRLQIVRDRPAMVEERLFASLMEWLPDDSQLFVGNSMAIRHLDTFMMQTKKDIRVFCNRGANGIDGVVSTALGVSAVSDRPTFLILGDLSFYHDMNGLLAAKLHELNLFVIVVNNDGGEIFSYLTQGKVEQHFEQLFGTPHGLTFGGAVEMYGGAYRNATSWSETECGFADLVEKKGLRLLEVTTTRKETVAVHQGFMSMVIQ